MENDNKTPKSSPTAILVTIILLLIIVGAAYIYQIRKAEAPVDNSAGSQSSAGSTTANGGTTSSDTGENTGTANLSGTATSVPGIQQYADPDFGFSFDYPNSWQATQVTSNSDLDSNIEQGTVAATLVVGPRDASGATDPQILIQEVHSPTFTITDTYYTDPNPTYFFDAATHTWMTVALGAYGTAPATTTADVSINTMGGLHMLGGSTNDNQVVIIPLSAENFLVINKIGGYDPTLLAKTVLATDPAVATPESAAMQTQIMQAEASAYVAPAQSGTPPPSGAQSSGTSGIVWKTYTDAQDGLSFQYPSTFADTMASLNNSPQVYVSATSAGIAANINADGCYKDPNLGPSQLKDLQVTLGSTAFCLSTGSDAGMSQLYTTYDYTTKHNSGYVTLQYVVHTTDGCGVFEGDPDYAACQYLSANYSALVAAPIQQSVASLTFTN